MASDVTTVVRRMIVSCRGPADQTRATAALIVPTVDNVADRVRRRRNRCLRGARLGGHEAAGRGHARTSLVRAGCTASSCRAGRATASIVSGAVTGGWSVRWVTGPIGPARGVTATAPPGVDTVTLELPDDDAD